MRTFKPSQLLSAMVAGLLTMLGTVVEAGMIDESMIVASLVDHTRLNGVEDVHIDGDYAYLPCREGSRVTIVNIVDPTQPTIVSSFTNSLLANSSGLAINGDTLYVASQDNHRLLILDASNKQDIKLLSSVVVGNGPTYKVAYQNGYAYVASVNDKKLYVVDVRNTASPRVVTGVPITDQADGPFSVNINGDYAYVGTLFGSTNRLTTIDIHDPENPTVVSTLTSSKYDTLTGVIVGDYFYANAWSNNGLFVFDVSDPANPREVGQLIDPGLGHPNRLTIAGQYAYLPMVDGDGVAVADISDPTNPRFVGSFSDSIMDKTYGVAVRGDYLFVGSREGDSLVVFNLQTAPEPGTIALLATGSLAAMACACRKSVASRVRPYGRTRQPR